MVRTDFVSNSSTTSFVVKNIDPNKIDNRFLHLLSKSTKYVSFIKDSKFSDTILDAVKKNENFDTYRKFYNDDGTFICTKNKLSTTDIPLLLDILKECNYEFEIDYGCDDCGEYVQCATQLATLFELLYDVEIDDEYYYDEESCYNEENKLDIRDVPENIMLNKLNE